jgi:hypothetical protein
MFLFNFQFNLTILLVLVIGFLQPALRQIGLKTLILFHHDRSALDFLLTDFFEISFHAVTYLLILGELRSTTIVVTAFGGLLFRFVLLVIRDIRSVGICEKFTFFFLVSCYVLGSLKIFIKQYLRRFCHSLVFKLEFLKILVTIRILKILNQRVLTHVQRTVTSISYQFKICAIFKLWSVKFNWNNIFRVHHFLIYDFETISFYRLW